MIKRSTSKQIKLVIEKLEQLKVIHCQRKALLKEIADKQKEMAALEKRVEHAKADYRDWFGACEGPRKLVSPEELARIQERTDIVAVISEYVKLSKHGNNYVGLCPFHQEKSPSFNVNPEKKIWHCFGCHSGGDIFKFLQAVKNWTFIEAVVLLARKAEVLSPAQADRQAKVKADYARIFPQS